MLFNHYNYLLSSKIYYIQRSPEGNILKKGIFRMLTRLSHSASPCFRIRRLVVPQEGSIGIQNKEIQMQKGTDIETKEQKPNDSVDPSIKDSQQDARFRFTTEGMPHVIAKKIDGLVDLLNQKIVDVDALKRHLAEGIPDEAALVREYCWKIILGYLPEEKERWPSTIEKQNQTYKSLVNMFLPDQKFPDYPLILKKDHPRFKELQSDYLLWQQIEKDTSRTHAEFSFFAMQSSQIMLPYLTSARREKFKLINGQDELEYKAFLASKQKQRKTYRYDYMTRILYIYSKLNPKIQYVQGMNEILAPIFYLVNVTKPTNAIEQASCFFMFNNAICDIIELHIKDLDKSKNGIHGKLNEVNQMLMVIDPSVWKRMEQLKIDPFYYCFRWITLLYAQDFPLFDTLRIWESIFSSDNRMQYIKFFAIAIIIYCKDYIIQNQFTVVLEYLQDIKQHIKVNEVIKIANQLLEDHDDKDFNALAIKEKKQIQKEWQKEKEKRQKDLEKEERQREKEEERNRKKQEKIREKEEKNRLKKEKEEKDIQMKEKGQGSDQAKEQKAQQGTDIGKVQKKIGGFFKKFGNMVDKILN